MFTKSRRLEGETDFWFFLKASSRLWLLEHILFEPCSVLEEGIALMLLEVLVRQALMQDHGSELGLVGVLIDGRTLLVNTPRHTCVVLARIFLTPVIFPFGAPLGNFF